MMFYPAISRFYDMSDIFKGFDNGKVNINHIEKIRKKNTRNKSQKRKIAKKR
jgi:hypothetical protein